MNTCCEWTQTTKLDVATLIKESTNDMIRSTLASEPDLNVGGAQAGRSGILKRLPEEGAEPRTCTSLFLSSSLSPVEIIPEKLATLF